MPERARGGAHMLRSLLAVLAAAAVGAALLGCGSSKKSIAFVGSTLEPPQPEPALSTLRNYDGAPFDLAAERGKAVFVTFLYAHCPDVCPLIAANLHVAYTEMPADARRHVAIVAVSADPRGDTPRAVAAFVHKHALTGEARYLIGSSHTLARVWEAWKVGSERDASNPGLVNHAALIYGIGANGKIYTVYPSNFLPSQIVHDVAPLLSRTAARG